MIHRDPLKSFIRPQAFPLIIAVITAVAVGAQTTQKPKPKSPPASASKAMVVDGTLEAALGQPRVHVQVSDGKHVLTAEPSQPAIDDHRENSMVAYLDTGAGGHVISKAAAARFGIKAAEGAIYNEVGLHGETKVSVSTVNDLALAGASGSLLDDPPAKFLPVQKEVAFQIARDSPSGVMALMGELNVIGMPAIRKMIIELDPTPMRGGEAQLGAGPIVRLLDPKSIPRNFDVEIPLEYIDFNQRKHPENHGPLPTLAPNPVITGVTSGHGDKTFVGDWLLDTGAAASVISIKHATALGLCKDDGTPALEPQFTLPLGGIEGDVKPAPGYVIDRITIKARSGKSLEFRHVHVVIKDIGTTLDDGRRVTLDGVLGMNLLLPSASGMASLDLKNPLDFDKQVKSFPGGFDRIVIDGPHGILSLKLH